MSPVTSNEILTDPIRNFPAATVACFDPTTGSLPRRSLDERRTIAFLDALGRCPVPAVLIGASTGHGHVRTVPELSAWLACAARAHLPATVLSALLRPEDGLAANRELIAQAADLGYPIVFFRPGRDLSPQATHNDVVANLAPVVAEAAARNLAVGVYSIPDVSGLPLPPEVVARLVSGPGGDRIVAVKVTESSYESSTLKFLEHPALRHLKVVQGWDPFLARALRDGPRFDPSGRQRCGITSGPMSFAVFQYLHILEQVDRGNWEEVEQAQAAVTTVFQSMQDDPQRFADLQRAKFVMGLGHPLTGAVSDAQIERIFQALSALPRPADRLRLCQSLDLLGDSPYHTRLIAAGTTS